MYVFSALNALKISLQVGVKQADGTASSITRF